MSKKKHIFLSYSRKDEKFAFRVVEDFKRYGLNIWIDQINIPDGKHWDKSIEEALNNSCAMVLIQSPDSANSDAVQDEVSFALDNHIQVMPIYYKETDLPWRWRRLQSRDINEKNYDEKIDGFIKSIKNFVSCEISDPPPRKPKRTWLKVASVLIIVTAVALTYIVNIKNDTIYNNPIKSQEATKEAEITKPTKSQEVTKEVAITKPLITQEEKEIVTIKTKPTPKIIKKTKGIKQKKVVTQEEIIEPLIRELQPQPEPKKSKYIDKNDRYATIYNRYIDELEKDKTTKLLIISHTNSNNEYDKAKKRAYKVSLQLRERGLHRSDMKTKVLEDGRDSITYDFVRTVR